MTSTHNVSAEERRRMIAEVAWNRAVARGFANGDPMTDWLEAEREIDARLNGAHHGWKERLEDRLATVKQEFKALKKTAGPRAKAAREEWKKNVEKLDKVLGKLEGRIEALSQRGEKATHKARAQAEKLWDEIAELRERLGRKPL
jgi:chromosome segregation ATPase